MNIVVLGEGFVGTYIINWLVNTGDHTVWPLNQTADQYYLPGNLSAFIDEHDIDTVINTCGYTGFPNVDACETAKAACAFYNITVPLQIEEECKLTGADFIHISSGCIYTGYDKDYTEEDEPNFGINNPDASFYSQTKHICEKFLDLEFTNVVRIRMPVTCRMDHKNLLFKLLKYDDIIDFRNSKTDIVKLCEFVEVVAKGFKPGLYNAVHSDTLSTKEVVDILKANGLENPNWEFVPYEELDIVANRSNCVLDNSKAKEVFGFDFGPEAYHINLNASIIKKSESCTEKV